MRITCERNALLEAASLCAEVAKGRTPRPALSGVLCTVHAGRLRLRADNGVTSVDLPVAADAAGGDGSFLVHAERFRDVLRANKDERVEVAHDGDGVVVTFADFEAELRAMSTSDFPAPVPAAPSAIEAQVSVMARLAQQTAFAAGEGQDKFVMNCVSLKAIGGTVEAAATNGRHLAVSRGPCEGAGAVLVPAKAMALLRRLMKDGEDTVSVGRTDSHVHLRVSGARVTALLPEGEFPPAEQIIPEPGDAPMTTPASKLLSAAERAALLLADGDSHVARFVLTADRLTITGKGNADVGSVTVLCDGSYKGPEVTQAYNPDLLAQALKVVGGDVTLEIAGPKQLCVVRSGDEFTYVLVGSRLA